jgi:DNA-binding NarL/FixJ family response regulator
LETFDDLELVGEAQDGMEVLRMCAQLQPNIVLMPVKLNLLDGIETTRLIREQFPPIHVVILSYSNLPQDLEAAIQAGASSYLIKGETGSTQIAAAIREANTLFSRFSFTTRS